MEANDTTLDIRGYLVKEDGSCPVDERVINYTISRYSENPIVWPPAIDAVIGIKITVYLIMILVSIIGNTLVILVVAFVPPMRKKENVYLLNLAVADLCVTIFCTWSHLLKGITHPHYVLSRGFCKVESFFAISSLAISVLTLVTISLSRFTAVVFPYRTVTSRSHAGKVVLAIWTLSLGLASPTIIYRDLHEYKYADISIWGCYEFWPVYGIYNYETKTCNIEYDSQSIFNTAFIICLYFIPVVIMIVCYSIMLWKLRQGSPGEAQPSSYLKDARRKKVRRTITIVIITFVLCWTPLQIFLLYATYFNNINMRGQNWFEVVDFLIYFVAFANSALNPIIYCCVSLSFRQGFKALFKLMRTGKLEFSKNSSRWRTGTGRTKETHLTAAAEDEIQPLQKNPSRVKNGLLVHYSENGGAKIELSSKANKELCTYKFGARL